MGKYRIRFKISAAKELESIPRKRGRHRLIEQIALLAEEPCPAGCQKLSGSQRYRLRKGRYRIVYAIEDRDLVVYVVKIGDRRDIYRRLY